jgi:methylamine dehydrogenase accessory protein MauD
LNVVVLEASVVLSWIVIAVMAVCLLALARQIGVLHERVAPVGALAIGGGPAVGDASPRVNALTLDGRSLLVGAPNPSGRPVLLLFVAPFCPVCKAVIPIARTFARSERIDIVFVGDGPQDELRAMVSRYALDGLPLVNSPEIGLAYQVGKLPYSVLLGPDGTIIAKGLVNSREHLESLVVAHQAAVISELAQTSNATPVAVNS